MAFVCMHSRTCPLTQTHTLLFFWKKKKKKKRERIKGDISSPRTHKCTVKLASSPPPRVPPVVVESSWQWLRLIIFDWAILIHMEQRAQRLKGLWNERESILIRHQLWSRENSQHYKMNIFNVKDNFFSEAATGATTHQHLKCLITVADIQSVAAAESRLRIILQKRNKRTHFIPNVLSDLIWI